MNDIILNRKIIENKISPIAARAGTQRHIMAVRDGFIGAMPFMIVGSFLLVFAFPPFSPDTTFFLGQWWNAMSKAYFNEIMTPFNMSMGIMACYISAGIAYNLAQSYKIDAFPCAMLSLMTFLLIAAPMNWMARMTRPLVWLLSTSSSVVLQLVGAKSREEPPVTNDEINVLMEQGAEAGVFHESEQAIVSNVLRLDEQRIAAIMTHRNDIYELDLDEPEEVIRACVAESPFTRIVVCRDGLEHVVGILRTADLLKSALAGEKFDVEKFLRPPLYVPEGVTTTHLLENFRNSRQQCALIVDEYGELQGLVTLTDVMTSIVGELPSSDITEEEEIIEREDGSLLIDGSLAIERLKQAAGIEDDLPGEDENAYNTLGGLVMYVLGRIPAATDHFTVAGCRFEVMDMDRNRVDKVLLNHLPEDASPAERANP